MRNTANSTSISSVVFRVIDVAGAGSARGLLALAVLREHLGYWQEQCLRGLAIGGTISRQMLNPMPGKPGQECLKRSDTRHSSDLALAVFTTPRSLAVRALSLS